MQEKIREAVKDSKSLSEVRDSVLAVFESYRQEGHAQIGYVSGIVTSEGPANIAKNIERLIRFTEHIRSGHNFPIFSATDVFTDELFARLDAAGFKNDDWIDFWRQTLGAEEAFVTDMFMTPRWESSRGAKDEYETAKRMRMTIHHVTEEL